MWRLCYHARLQRATAGCSCINGLVDVALTAGDNTDDGTWLLSCRIDGAHRLMVLWRRLGSPRVALTAFSLPAQSPRLCCSCTRACR